MRIDRLLLDILEWIGQVLRSKKDKTTPKPYEVLKQYRGKQGVLKLVERATPNAVRTYIFSPFQASQTNRVQIKKDIHICLDHLEEPRSARKSKQKSVRSRHYSTNSHRITVFEASRFLNKDGTYNTNPLYSEDFNLISNATHQHQFAIPIVDDLAMLLKEFPVDTIDWKFEIESGCKRHLGARWKPSSPTDETLANTRFNTSALEGQSSVSANGSISASA